jgi:primosomal protein N' (replication factor Y)
VIEVVFANIVIDIQARELKDRLFTYRIPEHLANEAFIGAQVLVPFGHRNVVGGYIISLTEHVDSQMKVKDIDEVVVPEPLFDKNYVDFLYWIADYYCSSLSDVISAAIPAVFTSHVKKIVSLTEKSCDKTQLDKCDAGQRAVINCISETKNASLAMTALKQRAQKRGKLSGTNFYRAITELMKDDLIRVSAETSQAQAPKLITSVILRENAEPPESSRQKELVALLQNSDGLMSLKNFLENGSTTHATVKKLQAQGIIDLVSNEDYRDPLAHLHNKSNGKQQPPPLTNEQSFVFAALSKALAQSTSESNKTLLDNEPWLLHGVTGSGKTEIYLRLIEQNLQAGRTALMLVPEISLTPQLARRLTDRFGAKISIWHSGLSDGEKYDTWRRIRAGKVQILLGARSAVLANLPNIGLIILDEEHDGSYKQSSPSPRYNAKDVAIERAKKENALVVFGSATPDIATYKRAIECKHLLEMTTRVHKQAMPKVTIVDMRQEFQTGNRGILSTLLETRLRKCLDNKEQAILLMNRRGFASHVFCRACGYVARCRNCSVSLVFHQSGKSGETSRQIYENGHLSCHHCGFTCPAFVDCPACRSPFIRQSGLGTQKVEQEVQELFPECRILRLDSDTAARKGSHEEVLTSFAEGGADILIGTQMVSKGLDIANVTLVGVIAADGAFNVPDYRSMERGFQLLTQVSGRAGRGDQVGSVVLQTYNPEIPVLNLAKMHDYKKFAIAELAARESFSYPPFSQLIRIVIYGADVNDVERESDILAEQISKYLEDAFSESAIQVLGPAPCLLERLRGKHRYHLLIKNFAGPMGQQALTTFFRHVKMPPEIVMAIDVDALDLM